MLGFKRFWKVGVLLALPMAFTVSGSPYQRSIIKDIPEEMVGVWYPTSGAVEGEGECSGQRKVCAEWIVGGSGGVGDSPYYPCCIDPSNVGILSDNPYRECPNLRRSEF